MRCQIVHCKTKLTKENTFVFNVYVEEEIKAGFPKSPARKIKTCIECAKLYTGKFWKEDNNLSYEVDSQLEFMAEFQKDIFKSGKKF